MLHILFVSYWVLNLVLYIHISASTPRYSTIIYMYILQRIRILLNQFLDVTLQQWQNIVKSRSNKWRPSIQTYLLLQYYNAIYN